jgi:HEAT repeat protein
MQAAFTLAQRNLQTKMVQPIFVEGLKHKDVGVRVQACQGLGMLGNHGTTGADGVKALTTAFKDPEAQVRQQALYALQSQRGDLSSIVPALTELVKDKDQSVRQQIIWMFQRTGETGVAPLTELLKDSDANIRVQAIQTLRNMGAHAKKALPAIKDAVKDENPNVRMNAMLLLATVGGEGPAFLVKQFDVEKDANTRAQILANLCHTGQHKLAAPLLKSAMSDKSNTVRQTTVNLLGYFGRDSKEAFEVFIMGLKDSDPQVRTQSAYNAGNYGNKAWDPLMDAMKGTKDTGFRQALLQGMMGTQFRTKASIEPLVDCLKDDNATVRQWTCIVLMNMGADAKSALPRLRELAKGDANQGVQNQAQAAIASIEKQK